MPERFVPERFVPRFAAEPPQEELPYGRWEQRLRDEFLRAAALLEDSSELGEPRELRWYPDRSWHGRTYVPATAPTAAGFELFGYVRFVPGEEQGGPEGFYANVDFTDETAERNPGWTLDLCDEVIGGWRGLDGAVAAITLVWGYPLLPGGRVATAELADVVVDQCELVEERFTLIAPDDFAGDLLQIKLYGARGQELARESLYEDEQQPQPEELDEDEPPPQ
jgi:hypothetical protein